MSNLFHTLFNDLDTIQDNDFAMEMINEMHGHMDLNSLSRYYDLTTYNNLVSAHDSPQVTVLHINSRSLSKNIDNIQSLLKCLNSFPDIIAITETWLTNDNKHLHDLPGYHSYHLVRNTRAQGGVSIYVSENLNSEQHCDLTFINSDIELNSVKITTTFYSFLVCAIYRPNSKHIAVNEFTNILTALLNDTAKQNKIVLIGDFNINLLEHTSHTPTNNFLANIQALSFTPHIARPTRFPDTLNLSEPSLLDHIYTNFCNKFVSGILHFPISDHLPIFLNISFPKEINKPNRVEFRNVNSYNKNLFSQKLNNVSWNNLLSSHDANQNFNTFLNIINDLYYECFPLKTKYISDKRLHNPWITSAVLKSVKTKNNLYKDYKIGVVCESYYKEYRNVLNKIIKNCKKQYYMSIFTNFKNNTSKIWKTINQLKNNYKKTYLSYITMNNQVIRNPSDMAEAFNKYFVDIAPNLDNNIPPTYINPLDFLRGDYPTSMSVPPVLPQDVVRVISSLKNKKSNTKEVSVSLLKANKEQIAVPLSILFNQSVEKDTFPQSLKHATVIPIYKKGPKDDIANYRPISLLSTYSKIFEKLMKKFLLSFLTAKSIINQDQYGFRQGLSTFSALTALTEKIYSALDTQQTMLTIYVDFTKAFDTV